MLVPNIGGALPKMEGVVRQTLEAVAGFEQDSNSSKDRTPRFCSHFVFQSDILAYTRLILTRSTPYTPTPYQHAQPSHCLFSRRCRSEP